MPNNRQSKQMNLLNEIIGGILLALFLSVTLLVRYAFIGRTLMRNIQTRLFQAEEEIRQHPLSCPLKQQMKKQITGPSAKKPSSLTECLQSRLLTREEETSFRNLFASTYPDMLPRLRSVCSRATRADELLCMLILLEQNNEETSYLLGISRPSVLKNRYRLRAKLELPEGVDLDTEVRRLLSPKADKNSL